MSFGWSVGDLLAAVNLTYTLISNLSDSQGACIEYQEAIHELGAFQNAFLTIERLRASNTVDPALLNGAFHLVSSAMGLIGDFLEKTKKHRQKCQAGSPGSMISTSWLKAGWTLFRKEELVNLKLELSQKLARLHLLLSTANIHGDLPREAYQMTYKSKTVEIPIQHSKTIEAHKENSCKPEALRIVTQTDYISGLPVDDHKQIPSDVADTPVSESSQFHERLPANLVSNSGALPLTPPYSPLQDPQPDRHTLTESSSPFPALAPLLQNLPKNYLQIPPRPPHMQQAWKLSDSEVITPLHQQQRPNTSQSPSETLLKEEQVDQLANMIRKLLKEEKAEQEEKIMIQPLSRS